MLNFSYACLLSSVEIIEAYFSFTPLSSGLHGCSVAWFCIDSPRTKVFADIWVAGSATLERVRGPGPGAEGAWTALQPWGAWSARTFPWQSCVGSLTPVCILASVPSLTFVVCAFITTDSARVLLFLLHLKADFSPDTANTAARGPCCRHRGPGAVVCCQHLYFKTELGEDVTVSIRPWRDSFLSYSKMLLLSICL